MIFSLSQIQVLMHHNQVLTRCPGNQTIDQGKHNEYKHGLTQCTVDLHPSSEMSALSVSRQSM